MSIYHRNVPVRYDVQAPNDAYQAPNNQWGIDYDVQPRYI